MDEEKRSILVKAGVDVEEAMDRFMNDTDLYGDIVKLFLEDPNFEEFMEAIQKKDYEEAFKGVHAMKGLCGNMSIAPLYDLFSKEVEYLRYKKYEEADALVPELESTYRNTVEALKQF